MTQRGARGLLALLLFSIAVTLSATARASPREPAARRLLRAVIGLGAASAPLAAAGGGLALGIADGHGHRAGVALCGVGTVAIGATLVVAFAAVAVEARP